MAETGTTLGARLREVRELVGLSVGQAAAQIGTALGVVRDHEADVYAPDDILLARYARLYRVAVAALRDGVAPAKVEDLRLPADQRARWERLSPRDRAELLRVVTWLRAGKERHG